MEEGQAEVDAEEGGTTNIRKKERKRRAKAGATQEEVEREGGGSHMVAWLDRGAGVDCSPAHGGGMLLYRAPLILLIVDFEEHNSTNKLCLKGFLLQPHIR